MSDKPNYLGCDCGGEHRTLGARAWCFDCSEYCSPAAICEVQDLRNEVARLRKALHDIMLTAPDAAIQDIIVAATT